MDEHGVIWAGLEGDVPTDQKKRLKGHLQALEEVEKARLRVEAELVGREFLPSDPPVGMLDTRVVLHPRDAEAIVRLEAAARRRQNNGR
jgi:hypothetical protein